MVQGEENKERGKGKLLSVTIFQLKCSRFEVRMLRRKIKLSEALNLGNFVLFTHFFCYLNICVLE